MNCHRNRMIVCFCFFALSFGSVSAQVATPNSDCASMINHMIDTIQYEFERGTDTTSHRFLFWEFESDYYSIERANRYLWDYAGPGLPCTFSTFESTINGHALRPTLFSDRRNTGGSFVVATYEMSGGPKVAQIGFDADTHTITSAMISMHKCERCVVNFNRDS